MPIKRYAIKPVPGFPNWEAGESGKVYRNGIEVIAYMTGGYPTYSIDGQKIGQSKMVCLAFHGNKPFPAAEVRHLNDVKTDNRPVNLAWGTHSENMYDKYRNGYQHQYGDGWQPVGEEQPSSKLTECEVLDMRDDHASGLYNYAELGRMYGVNRSQARDIINRKYWKHI